MAEARGTALMEIPVDALEAAARANSPEPDAEKERRWPKRIRMKPLEFWRNEKVEYERLPGSATPSIARVTLNMAPRAESLGEREIQPEIVQQAVPLISEDQDQVAEFVNAKTDLMVSKLVVLPPASGRANPPTYLLPPFAKGQISVLEGSLRYAYEGEEDAAILNVGDHVCLPAVDQAILLASAGARGASTGAKFKLVLVYSDGNAENEEALPVGWQAR